MDATRYLRNINMGLMALWATLTLGICFIGVSPYNDAATWAYIFLQLVCLVGVLVVVTGTAKYQRVRVGMFSICIGASIIIVGMIALWGFYSGSTVATDSSDYTGTWVADHSLKTAFIDSFISPAPFIAALFGYSCDGGMQGNCSQVLYVSGIVATEAILVGGVVLGNILARRARSIR